MNSKQRAYLKGLAMTMEPVLQIGKSSLTPEFTEAVSEALEARELIKINVLKNCADDGRELAQMLAERTRSQVVQVIGRKIVLYRPAKEEKKRKSLLLKTVEKLQEAYPRRLLLFLQAKLPEVSLQKPMNLVLK